MDEAEFSVVIPAKNRSAMLGRAISSALQQTLPPKEIIVVDDGSDEPDFFLLSEKFPQVKWLRQKNKGVSAARNRGIEMASCQWIALLDSDDLWHEEKLLSQSRFIGKNPDIPAVHTDERWIRSGNEVMPPKYLDKSPNGLWERSLENCLICASSIAIHQSVFEKIGLFDEELEVCEDTIFGSVCFWKYR